MVGALIYLVEERHAPEVDVEDAVISYGKSLGPFSETAGLAIERDARFPIRVTVQFYQATSNGQIDAATINRLAQQINRVYAEADYVGSLVTDARAKRPTASLGPLESACVLGGFLE